MINTQENSKSIIYCPECGSKYVEEEDESTYLCHECFCYFNYIVHKEKDKIAFVIMENEEHKKEVELAKEKIEKQVEEKNKDKLNAYKKLNQHASDIYMLFKNNDCIENTAWFNTKRPKKCGCKKIEIKENKGHYCEVKIIGEKRKHFHSLRDDYPDNEFEIVWEHYDPYEHETEPYTFIVPDRYYSMTIPEIIEEWNKEYEKLKKEKEDRELKKKREEYEKLKKEFENNE